MLNLDYGLTEVYREYQKSKNYKGEGYGTLYKLMGGKKEVPEFSYEMCWYLFCLDKINRASETYRKKRMAVEEDISNAKSKEEIEEIKLVYNNEIREFLKSRFESCLVYLTNYFDVKIEIAEDSSRRLQYFVKSIEGILLMHAILDVFEFYAFGNIHKALNYIFIDLKCMKQKEYPKIEEMQTLMNDLNFVINHLKVPMRLENIKDLKVGE